MCFIQTVRRVNPVIHMLLVLLLLYCVGLENLARFEPSATVVSVLHSCHKSVIVLKVGIYRVYHDLLTLYYQGNCVQIYSHK